MLPLRCLLERKKLLLLLVASYGVLYRFAYKRFWKEGVLIPVLMPIATNRSQTSSWSSVKFFPDFGLSVNSAIEQSSDGKLVIAIGSGITSRKLTNVFKNNIGQKFQFFTTFLPTFCRTANQGFIYGFYLAYDRSDRVFANQRLRDAFHRQFHDCLLYTSDAADE